MSEHFVFRELRKSVNGRRLLNIEEFSIPEQTCIVLSGRNGAGKSTLLRILAGLEPPDHCVIVHRGTPLSWKAARRRFRRDIVYLHQHPYMFDCSVSENIAYGLRHAGIGRSESEARVAQALEWADLAHLSDRNARHLSGGEQQRVALTRARILSPRLLLLDEPFANMDIESRENTISLIKRLREEGISTIITSHEPDIATLIGDEHRHLCKTGPCRYTIVRPFLYQPNIAQKFRIAERRTIPWQHNPAEPGEPVNSFPGKTGGNSEQNRTMENGNYHQLITAVILAGGQARRMGGEDKGLIPLDGKPMIEHILTALVPQVGSILINANRNLERYRDYGYPVIEDMMGDYFGPLVGMASGVRAATTPLLLTVPCDSPFVPDQLSEVLYLAMQENQAEISVAHDGDRMQPVFALLRRELLPSLLAYLENGGRKIDTWYGQHRLALADFSKWPDTFLNINTPADKLEFERRISQSARG